MNGRRPDVVKVSLHEVLTILVLKNRTPVFYPTMQLFLAAVLTLSSVSGVSTLPFHSALAKVIRAATHNFLGCNVIVLTDENQIFEVNIHKAIENLIHQSTVYNIRLNAKTQDRFFSIKHHYGQHLFFTAFGPVSRHRPSCALAITFLENFNVAVADLLFKFLTPKHLEIIKKDQDHFIFVTLPALVHPLLLSSQFSSKIKFKIAIPFDETSADVVVIKSTCFFCDHGKPEVIDILKVDTNKDAWKLSMETDKLFPDMVTNFNGFELVAANSVRTFQRTEMIMKDGKYEPVRGLYFIILFSIMKPHFNFTVKLIPSYGDGGTGLLLKNGTWFGSVGDILLERAHIGMVSGQNVQRNKAVGFAFSLAYEWITFSTRKPKGIFTWEAIYRPFDFLMWTLVTLSLAATILAFFGMSKFLHDGWNMKRIVNYIIGSALDQSCSSPSYISLRTLCACWLMFSLIVSTAYRSKLFGFLMFPDILPIPQDFTQLAESKEYSWGLNYVAGAAYAIFATSQEATYKKIFGKMELVNDSYQCYHKSVTSNYGCISWQSFADYLSARNFTDKSGRSQLVVAPSFTFFISCGWVLEKRAIFRTNFDRVLHMGHDTGLVLKWEQMDWDFVRKRRWDWERNAADQTGKSVVNDEGGPTPLHVDNLIGGFYALVICLVVSGVAFVLEMVNFGKKRATGGKWIHVRVAVATMHAFQNQMSGQGCH